MTKKKAYVKPEINIYSYKEYKENEIKNIENSDTMIELMKHISDNPDGIIESLVKENEKLKLENLDLKNKVDYYEDLSKFYELRIEQLQEKQEVKQ